MKIVLNNSILDAIDMSFANPTNFFSWNSGQDHYRLLTFLSRMFENRTLVDIGTRDGGSAIALANTSTNLVESFDIMTVPAVPYKNVTYNVQNIFENQSTLDLILKSPFISLDIDHLGKVERQFMNFLIENKYDGILYLDDIDTDMFPEMRTFWKEITQRKIDVTKYGHLSGSGLVLFNENIEIVCE